LSLCVPHLAPTATAPPLPISTPSFHHLSSTIHQGMPPVTKPCAHPLSTSPPCHPAYLQTACRSPKRVEGHRLAAHTGHTQRNEQPGGPCCKSSLVWRGMRWCKRMQAHGWRQFGSKLEFGGRRECEGPPASATPPAGGSSAGRTQFGGPWHGTERSASKTVWCVGSITRERATGRAPVSPRTGVKQKSKS
jgi:hypothetical protein